MNDSIDIITVNKKIKAIIELCRDHICKDALSEIIHYIDNSEPEIAFEGLFIELIQLGTLPKNIIKASCVELGRDLNLNRESVLDDDFWNKFIAFLE